MPSVQDLEPLLNEPREDLGAEYKDWLDLSVEAHRAKLAKAAIALINHGGGFIVVGFSDNGKLSSHPRPTNSPQINQDEVNACIRKYASIEFHCQLYSVLCRTTGISHPIIVVPGTMAEPVMSKRDCQGEITTNKCYIRKPGPRTEEPFTSEEWRSLIGRCIRAARSDMLESIRSIVTGSVGLSSSAPSTFEILETFRNNTHLRWSTLIAQLPAKDSSRLADGYYEMAFSLCGATPASGLVELKARLEQARRIRLTGWTPFLEMSTPEWAPYAYENYIEAWVGRPHPEKRPREPAHCDFWRVSTRGQLYTIRGHQEDSLESHRPKQIFDIVLPVWRIAEGILFARRLADTFEDVTSIAIICRYTGLQDRRLSSITRDRLVFDDHISRSDEMYLKAEVTLQQIDDNLVETMLKLLTPLYERFGFFQLPVLLVEQELGRMTKGRT